MNIDRLSLEVRGQRGPAVVDRILAATLSLLTERGYGFSVDEVALVAEVNKTTIYRRWRSKPVLVAAAIERLAEVEIPIPKTDSPLADLRTLVQLVGASLNSSVGRQAIRSTIAASAEDPEITEIARQFLTNRYHVATEIIERCIAEGSIRSSVDPVLMLRAIVNPLHLHVLLGGVIDDEMINGLIDLVLQGAQSASST